MSYPIFKDFDKSSADIISDDFDNKYTLKIKSAGPSNTTITTNTAYDAKENKLVPKLSTKWVHGSGFTLEKLEFSPDLKLTVETSLSGVAPGLKLEFKGNDSDKADVTVTYSVPAATVTADIDVHNFSSAKASVSGGHGPFSAGASADLKISKSAIDSTTIGLGFGYTVPKLLFFGLRANKNFADYSALFSYSAYKNITLAGLISYSPKETSAVLASVYKCNPDTTIKVKAATTGVFYASIKQAFDKKFSVVGSAEIPSSLSSVKFGINATLG